MEVVDLQQGQVECPSYNLQRYNELGMADAIPDLRDLHAEHEDNDDVETDLNVEVRRRDILSEGFMSLNDHCPRNST